MNVLSVFDGMSCGQIALVELGFKIDKYYAAEIDKPAITQTQHNFPNTIQLGSVTDVKAKDLEKIDLFIGGSPCQGFSFAGKQLNFDDPRSALFFEYVRLWKEIKAINPNAVFLLENVNMKKEYLRVISEYLGVFPVRINSNLVSAQNRDRWYWSNIKTKDVGLFAELWTDIPEPKDKGILLNSVLQPETEIESKYILSDNAAKRLLNIDNDGFKSNIKNGNDKAACVFASQHKLARGMDMIKMGCVKMGRTDEAKKIRRESMKNGKDYTPFQAKQINNIDYEKMNTITCATTKDNILTDGSRFRRLTPIECARLQTIPKWYEWIVSDTQIYRMLGNGWTVEVIKHIFSFLNGFEKTNVRGQKINYGQISTNVESENECSTCG